MQKIFELMIFFGALLFILGRFLINCTDYHKQTRRRAEKIGTKLLALGAVLLYVGICSVYN